MSTTLSLPRRDSARPRRSAKARGTDSGTLAALRAARTPGVKTFGEIYHRAAGCVDSGLGDLSTNKKYLANLGRD
ncbi:MAG: hypothetical protein RLZZ15_2479 [Verrucomicrobiota bacterium]|jgi:hypothetical protein